MKILVTGSSGFIGSSIVEAFRNTYDILAPSSNELDLTKSSVVLDFLEKNRFDIVIHAANHHVHPLLKSGKNPNIQFENNLRMFFNIASYPDLYNHLIYFGSGAEFSREHWNIKMKEEHFGHNIPVDQYGMSKYIMNLHSRKSVNIYNLRLFGVFGEKDDWRYRFIPNLCARSVLGKDLIIKQNAIFNFLYISDLFEILKKFIENPQNPGDYNVCDDRDFELIELAELIRKKSGVTKKIIVKEEGLSTMYGGDNSKLKETYPDIQFTPINESISRVYDDLLSNSEKINSSEFLIN